MAACPKCGSVISEGAVFCSVCGSPVSSVTGPSPTAGTAAAAGLASNVAAALSYLGWFVTGIIFLVIEPYRRDGFVRFHAFQSILLTAALVAFNIIWGYIVLGAFYSIGFLWSLFSVIGGLVYLAFILLWLFLMYKAYNKESFKVPIIGDIAAKQAAR